VESLAVISMIVAMAIMFSAVICKVMLTQLINKMQRRIDNVNQEKQKALGQLKMIKAQKAVLLKNKGSLEQKKTKMSKKIARLQKDMKELTDDADHRQKLNDTMRGKLIRPTRAEG